MELDPARQRISAGEFMIESIDIHHFKCFRHTKIEGFCPINVIVGDNGSGKTALMEAIFLALGTDTGLIGRYRQQRGAEGGTVSGLTPDIEDAIFSEMFFDNDLSRTVSIVLKGTGAERRTVRIEKGISNKAFEFFKKINPNFIIPPSSYKPFTACWTDENREERFTLSQFIGQAMQWGGTGELTPNFFYYAANQTLGPLESSSRFSALSKSFKEDPFKKPIIEEFPFLQNLSLELSTGYGIIHATVNNLSNKIPVPNLSGAINRIITLLITMATAPGGIMLVDEMENGVYYRHQESVWRAILKSARDNKCQIITSTHSLEWLRALIAAAADDVSDIALWRIERGEKGEPEFFRFDGRTLRAGVEFGADPRGSSE